MGARSIFNGGDATLYVSPVVDDFEKWERTRPPWYNGSSAHAISDPQSELRASYSDLRHEMTQSWNRTCGIDLWDNTGRAEILRTPENRPKVMEKLQEGWFIDALQWWWPDWSVNCPSSLFIETYQYSTVGWEHGVNEQSLKAKELWVTFQKWRSENKDKSRSEEL